MSRFLAVAVCFVALQTTARADENITPETIDLVKKASVYIRVEGEGWSATGSGFVVVSDEKSVLVATNRHVAEPVSPTAPEAKGAKITVVFDSGTKTERSYTGTVIGADSERDLAVLRVTGVKDAPRPIAYQEVAKPTELMQVFTFGFPFGKALAMNKGAPAITVGKASISSLRNGPDGELSIIQIDGNLNPGNSGGPIVDSKGRLVGIAVATIRDGQGIGLTIPAAELGKLMQGRVGRVRFTRKKSESDSTTIRIEADLIDPIENLRSATAHYFVLDPKTPKAKRPETEALDKHPGSKKIELKIEKGVAAAEFTVPAADGELLVQVMAAPDGKEALATKVRAISLTPLPKLSVFAGPAPAGWKEYAPKDKTYTMWVPEKPEKQSDGERILLAARQRIRVNTMAGKAESGLIYEAQSIVLPASFSKVPQKDLYDMFQGSAVSGKKGRVTESKEAEMAGKSGFEYFIEADDAVTRLRMSCSDLRVSIVMVTGEVDQVASAEAEMFLSSYRPSIASVAGPKAGKEPAIKEPTILGGAYDPEFKDMAPANGFLVGFEIGLVKILDRDMIRAAKPIYRVGDKETFGEQHGTQVKNLITVKAKEGYAVGAISVKPGLGFDAMSITFMKIVDGKLDPKDSYESEYVGTEENKTPTKLGGDGTPVIGIVGKENNKDLIGMGLLFKGQEGYEPKKNR